MPTLTITSVVTGAPATPSDVQDQWYNGLFAASSGKISSRWLAIVGTDTLWTDNVATPSGRAYKPYPNVAFVSKRGRDYTVITGLQQKKLQSAQAKALANFNDMFAGGGTKYQERILAKAGHFSANMPNTLAMTGARITGKRGPASVHVRAIASDQTYLRDSGGTTTVTGDVDPLLLDPPHYRYVIAGLSGFLKAGLAGKITQIGVEILQNVITDATPYNAELTTALQAMLRTAYKSGSSMQFVPGGGGFTLVTIVAGDDPV